MASAFISLNITRVSEDLPKSVQRRVIQMLEDVVHDHHEIQNITLNVNMREK